MDPAVSLEILSGFCAEVLLTKSEFSAAKALLLPVEGTSAPTAALIVVEPNSFVKELSDRGESGKDSGDLMFKLFKLPTMLEEGVS